MANTDHELTQDIEAADVFRTFHGAQQAGEEFIRATHHDSVSIDHAMNGGYVLRVQDSEGDSLGWLAIKE